MIYVFKMFGHQRCFDFLVKTASSRANFRSNLQKMKELQSDEASGREKMLRLSIEAGGCSGFQYNFSLDDKTDSDDRFFLFTLLSDQMIFFTYLSKCGFHYICK